MSIRQSVQIKFIQSFYCLCDTGALKYTQLFMSVVFEGNEARNEHFRQHEMTEIIFLFIKNVIEVWRNLYISDSRLRVY